MKALKNIAISGLLLSFSVGVFAARPASTVVAVEKSTTPYFVNIVNVGCDMLSRKNPTLRERISAIDAQISVPGECAE
ncbi:hypothetical protein [uncultured Cedecea sp.]|uniref:hypothetical protein n=1 Tax=uncultured Cedecea sp. TaxID=988762 RepID=UPI00261A99B3|nr:hypothetical protein [uncultured Cedecea sp.]